uniref:Uncharacterized protein n=1 Tax=Medicago truncatula TaxID=3880 RepID=A2Q4S1_MEDTR|nr:hypothetical protein MtrDRAFT_AC157777g33v2 [Medicago truncatula]
MRNLSCLPLLYQNLMDHQLMDQHLVVLEQLLYKEMHHHLNHSQ